jgi:hypothetical protein
MRGIAKGKKSTDSGVQRDMSGAQKKLSRTN